MLNIKKKHKAGLKKKAGGVKLNYGGGSGSIEPEN